MRLVYKFCIAIVVFWIGTCGIFIMYVISCNYQYDNTVFDNIVVLTGGHNRIAHAFRLMKSYKPKNIFISGVYKKTTLRDILPSGYVENIRIILGKQAKNTRENALEINKWAKQNEISEILLITSDYHIPRSMTELKFASDSLKIYPYAVKSDVTFKFVEKCVKELHKIVYVYIRNFAKRVGVGICY